MNNVNIDRDNNLIYEQDKNHCKYHVLTSLHHGTSYLTFLWFNSVSTAGLYLPTMYLVSLASQLFDVHTSAYDWLLAANLFLFETILTF